MKARTQPRVIPSGSSRYHTVDMGDHGEHVLRAPTFAGAAVVRRVNNAAVEGASGGAGSQQWMEEISTAMGSVVGLCWWHTDMDLDATRPGYGAEPDAWLEYGDAVCDELMEQGYGIADLYKLHVAAIGCINAVHAVATEAEERADFSDGPEGEIVPVPAESAAAAGATP